MYVCVYVCVCVCMCASMHAECVCLKDVPAWLAFALFFYMYVGTPSRTCYCVAYGMIRISQQ